VTALKPLDTRRVTGQVASRYPLNMWCAMPECVEEALDAHHIFPRSQIGSTLWFVQAWDADEHEMFASPLAHVTGLCREHHGDVEEHRAWIKLEQLEGELVFVWYGWDEEIEDFARIGPLDPQPGGRQRSKARRRRFTTDEQVAKRKSTSLKFPVGFTGLDWKELLQEVEVVELQQDDTPFDPKLGKVAAGKLVVTVLERYAGRTG
jgi:hypothetical protein